jgi:hypothetical protein
LSGDLYLYAQIPGVSKIPAYSTKVTLSTAASTTVEAPGNAVASFDLIPTLDDPENPFPVLRFKVQDNALDNTPTLISSFKISIAGTGLNAPTDIAGVKLFAKPQGAGSETEVTGTAVISNPVAPETRASIVFTPEDTYSITESNFVEFTVKIYMSPLKLAATEGQTYIFSIDESGITIPGNVSSSRMAPVSVPAKVTPVIGTIFVDATHIEVLTAAGSSTATVTAGVPLPLKLQGVDANKNIDIHYANDHTLNFSGLDASPLGNKSKIKSSAGTYTTLGNDMTITFTNGVSLIDSYSGNYYAILYTYNRDNKALIATEAGKSTFGLDVTANAAAPKLIAIVSGETPTQSGAISWPLTQPFVVKISDDYGNAAGTGTEINFTISAQPTGAGAILKSGGAESTTALTLSAGNDGKASVILTIGSLSGAYQVTVTAEGLTGSGLIFHSTGLAPGAIQIIDSSNNQTNEVTLALAPMIVRVVDNSVPPVPIPNKRVNFVVSTYPTGAYANEAAALAALSVTSVDSSALTATLGEASTILTLGTKSGPYKVTASATGIASVELSATASAAAAHHIALDTGTGSVKAGVASAAFNAVIKDTHDNNAKFAEPLILDLTTSAAHSTTGFFYSDSGCAEANKITSVEIPANSSNATFYYKDRLVGLTDITVTTASYSPQLTGSNSAVKTISIIPAELGYFTLSSAQGAAAIAAGEPVEVSITAHDNQDNIKTDYTSDSVNVVITGANTSLAPSQKKPTLSDKNGVDVPFGDTTTLAFTNGISAPVSVGGVPVNNNRVKLYKVEDAALVVTSGSVTTPTPLPSKIKHSAADHLRFNVNLPATANAGVKFEFGNEVRLNVVDLYDNVCNTTNQGSGYSESIPVSWSIVDENGVNSPLYLKSPDGIWPDKFCDSSTATNVVFTNGVSPTGLILSAQLYYAQTAGIIPNSATALTGANLRSNFIVVSSGSASQMRFKTQPSPTGITTQVLAIQPEVAIADQYGNPVSSSTTSTIDLTAFRDTSVPHAADIRGTLSATGGTTKATVNGVATFSGMTYNYPEDIFLLASVSDSPLAAVYSSRITFTTAAEATVTANAAGVTEISSVTNNAANAVKANILNFKITDAGQDGYATGVKQVVVMRDTAVDKDTTGGWLSFINSAYITDGATSIPASKIEDDQIIFGFGTDEIYSIANNKTSGASKNFSISVLLKNSLPAHADNKKLGFKIVPTDNIILSTPGSSINPSSVAALSALPKIVVAATNFIISGSNTMNAGDTQAITIKATDSLGNIDENYTGPKTIVFSGASVAVKSPTLSYYPVETTSGIQFGSDTPVSFNLGESSSQVGIQLFKSELAVIKATEGTVDNPTVSTANANALTILVSGGSATSLNWLTQPATVIVENAPWKEFSIAVVDNYGNTSSSALEVSVAVTSGEGVIPATAIKKVAAQSGIATFYNFAVGELSDGQRITLSGSATGVTGTGPSTIVTVYKKYAVTVRVMDYTSASALTECTLNATKNGVQVAGFPMTHNSPFTFDLTYGVYNFTVTKEKYVDENTEKTAGADADYLDGKYDAIIPWTITATSLTEASADYKVQSAFVYDESTDKLSIRAWLEKRGKMVLSDEVNKLGSASINVYDDTANSGAGAWLTPIVVTRPDLVDATNGVYLTEVANAVATNKLASGKTYYAKIKMNYGGQLGDARVYEGGTTFSVTVNQTLKAVTSAIQSVTTTIAGQTNEIKSVVKDEIQRQVETVIVPKITDVKTETAKILTATGTESLQTKIDTVKTAVVNEVQPHVKSGILNRDTAVKSGGTIAIRYRTDTGLAPRLNVYNARDLLVVTNKVMPEIGATGIYEVSVKFLSSWGLGDFTIICSEPTKGTVDALVISVSQYDIEGISNDVSAIMGSTAGITGLRNVTDTIGSQFSDMDKLLSKISKDVAGKLGDAKAAVNDMALAFKQLEDMSKQIKDIGGTTGINLEKLYEVSKDKKEDITYIKNKSEELKAAMEINQKMIENVAKKPVVQTWFEFK